MPEGRLLCPPLCPYQGYVFTVTNAFPVKLSEDVQTARHKPGRLLDKPDFTSSVVDAGGHEESAHVSLGDANRRMLENLVDALQVP